MALHRHKVFPRPGPAEYGTVTIAVLAALVMIAGPMMHPGTDWQQVVGQVLQAHIYPHATHPDGLPRRVALTYAYEARGIPYRGTWDGEWPRAHSPNALLPNDLDRLKAPAYPITVMYDPLDPARSQLHETGNVLPGWWLRLSLGLAMLAFWHTFVIYPHWKQRM